MTRGQRQGDGPRQADVVRLFSTAEESLRNWVGELATIEVDQRVRVDAYAEKILDDPSRLPPGEGELPERITDFVAGMTDRYALAYLATLDS